MRTYAVLYDARPNKYVIMFRDDDDPMIDNRRVALTIVNALNAMQEKV